MEGSNLRKLRIWHDFPRTVICDPAAPAANSLWAGPHHPADFGDTHYGREAPTRVRGNREPVPELEPYTLQWFLNIETQRHGRQGRWIPRLLEFAKHRGEVLLGLGNGLGTDWLQYARHGAAVVVCSPSAEQLGLIRRNFELRGLSGRFLHAAATALPLESASIDVACISGLLHEVNDPQPVIDEVYRVLKPGGKVLAVAPGRYDVDFWYGFCFPWQAWLRGRPAIGRSRGVQFSARRLRHLFGRFIDHRIHKRHLGRSDVPHVWRWIPRQLLERVMGRVLVLKSFKPFTALSALQAAA
jgi:SAM-dependent methyltransferase